MSRGVILYGYEVDAVARALRELNPLVPVVCCRDGAEADAARAAAPGTSWQVVELYRPGADLVEATDVQLWLNTTKVDPTSAARAIDQPDLVTWCEVINPIRSTTVDGGPTVEDYSNLRFIVQDGHRTVAHAVRLGEPAPSCLPDDAELVLRSDDLWMLPNPPTRLVCPACAARHG